MKKTTPTHSIIILLKTRENLKSVRRKETGIFREERVNNDQEVAGEAVFSGEKLQWEKMKRMFRDELENVRIPLILSAPQGRHSQRVPELGRWWT